MWKGRENEAWKVEALKLASEVSNNNLSFIQKITGENGGMDFKLQSRVRKKIYVLCVDMPSAFDCLPPDDPGYRIDSKGFYYGPREDSWGYCQIHRQWHSAIVDDPRFFTDKRWQMEQCYRLWSGGTKFYAPPTPASQFYLTSEL